VVLQKKEEYEYMTPNIFVFIQQQQSLESPINISIFMLQFKISRLHLLTAIVAHPNKKEKKSDICDF
jgi:Zn-dependent peptidase ImmA (M78 family)